MSRIQMMPIVFCASLPPCPRLYSDEEKSCKRRKIRSTRLGVERTKIHEMARNRTEPRRKPSSGEMKMNATGLRMPAGIKAHDAALATPAPTSPRISACEDEEGMP